MIVVEEKINEVLSQLPTVLGLTPIYAWGNEKHLNKWVEKKPDTYPLIYQTSKNEEQNVGANTVKTNWEAVIATQNKNTDLFNDERWALSFRNALNPLAENIVKGFELAGFIIENDIVNTERYGNYGDGDKHFTIDIWDAMTFKCTLIINNNCINQGLFL